LRAEKKDAPCIEGRGLSQRRRKSDGCQCFAGPQVSTQNCQNLRRPSAPRA
jgi:hypothetical protein